MGTEESRVVGAYLDQTSGNIVVHTSQPDGVNSYEINESGEVAQSGTWKIAAISENYVLRACTLLKNGV